MNDLFFHDSLDTSLLFFQTALSPPDIFCEDCPFIAGIGVSSR